MKLVATCVLLEHVTYATGHNIYIHTCTEKRIYKMMFLSTLKPTVIILFSLHIFYNAVAIPTNTKAHCSDVELKKEKDLLNPHSFACPKERSKLTLAAAVDKIFGGDKWWKKVFSHKKLNLVDRPEEVQYKS